MRRFAWILTLPIIAIVAVLCTLAAATAALTALLHFRGRGPGAWP